ncbi:MAG TPA: twin-arginine translocase TatA/TatE family subunit [Candidatus Limnocylindrales bacterium]|jgi:sec-independent protein translocase protein TatA|nr:twin-arginine translocase TatA/TatE family subunit [Candidatus Limnocylindrales bacterium]
MFLRDLLIPSHLLFLLLLMVVFFGGKKLPQFGKGLGDGIRQFRHAVKDNLKLGGSEPNDLA